MMREREVEEARREARREAHREPLTARNRPPGELQEKLSN